MDTESLIQNIHFIQKLTLMCFLLLISVYYQIKQKYVNKTKINDELGDTNLFGDLFEQLMHYGSLMGIILFPLFLVFLEYTVSFYIFVGLLLAFYTCFVIVAGVLYIWHNGHKLWQILEGWF